jgi:hypothetical protein
VTSPKGIFQTPCLKVKFHSKQHISWRTSNSRAGKLPPSAAAKRAMHLVWFGAGPRGICSLSHWVHEAAAMAAHRMQVGGHHVSPAWIWDDNFDLCHSPGSSPRKLQCNSTLGDE